MKRVLVTGTTGFIGSHLVPLLRRKGYKVYKLERYMTGRMGKTVPYPEDTYFADLRDVSAVLKAVKETKPDAVIHLGAITAVAYSYAHWEETLKINFMGTVNIAQVCADFPCVKQFIFASSAEVYGLSRAKIKCESDTDLVPNSPYAVSKLAAEKYLIYLYKAFNFPITILRPFNSYGRKDDTWFVVERAIIQMITEDKCYMGDPSPVRDLLYVDDQLNAYLYALENPKAIGEVFNVSSGKGVSIRELVEKVKDLTSFEGEVVWHALPRRALDIPRLVGDNGKIKRVLRVPKPVSLDEGLRLTIDYWREKLRK